MVELLYNIQNEGRGLRKAKGHASHWGRHALSRVSLTVLTLANHWAEGFTDRPDAEHHIIELSLVLRGLLPLQPPQVLDDFRGILLRPQRVAPVSEGHAHPFRYFIFSCPTSSMMQIEPSARSGAGPRSTGASSASRQPLRPSDTRGGGSFGGRPFSSPAVKVILNMLTYRARSRKVAGMANELLPPDLITLSEAAQLLGVSRPTMGRLVTRVPLQTYQDPLDARAKLVRLADVERLRVRKAA